jgi:thioredoxin 1
MSSVPSAAAGPTSADAASEPLLLACLCAAWCGTCTSYRALFDSVAARHPEARLVWVDVEDHADALEDGDDPIPDIENFPTLLLLRGTQPVFHGTVLPHADVAERLLQQAAHLSPVRDPEVQALGHAVQALAASGALDD